MFWKTPRGTCEKQSIPTLNVISGMRCAEYSRVLQILKNIWKPQKCAFVHQALCVFYPYQFLTLEYEASTCAYKASHLKSNKINRSWRGRLNPTKNITLITRVLYSLANHFLTPAVCQALGLADGQGRVTAHEEFMVQRESSMTAPQKSKQNPQGVLHKHLLIKPRAAFLYKSVSSLPGSPKALTDMRGSHGTRASSRFPSTRCFLRGSRHLLNPCRGAWVAQLAECLTSARVIISWLVSSSPTSSSLLSLQSLFLVPCPLPLLKLSQKTNKQKQKTKPKH